MGNKKLILPRGAGVGAGVTRSWVRPLAVPTYI
ncbi:unnamed protein product, partial [marine sediment metagenome]